MLLMVTVKLGAGNVGCTSYTPRCKGEKSSVQKKENNLHEINRDLGNLVQVERKEHAGII